MRIILGLQWKQSDQDVIHRRLVVNGRFGTICRPIFIGAISWSETSISRARPWYADTRVERDGITHRCLPCYQRWTHWASVKYIKKKNTWTVSLSIGVRITMIRCVVYLLRNFKLFHGLMNNPVLCLKGLLHTSLEACVRFIPDFLCGLQQAARPAEDR